MGRGSAASTSKGGGGGGGGGSAKSGGGLVLECESESLSEAQLTKLQKLTHDVSKLQLMLQNPQLQKVLEEAGVGLNDGLVNGTGSNVATTVTQPLTNGTGVVGLQMPQFLLLQNGQMIAASSPIPTTTTSDNFPASSAQVVANMSNSVNAGSKVPALSERNRQSRRAAAVAANNNLQNQNSNSNRSSPDIEILRSVRFPRGANTTQSPSTSGNTVSSSGVRSSSGPAVTGSSSSSSNNQAGGSGSKNFPLLNVMTRPKNTLSPAEAMTHRKELDAKVKAVLVRSPQEFVEWLLSEGLIRTSQFCTLHHMGVPIKLRLGMFSDPKVLATSGGYVWISECCGKKYVSVYSGSIFGSTPIDKVPPTSVLKLVYHWACQTSISNVESWVKVDKVFVNKMYGYLRCVCSVMLQDKVYDFGFDGTTVELGIVSLGTSTADGSKKAVKVEILGLYDRKMKSFRLFASEPEPGSSSRQRFVRILQPLEKVVHPNAIVLCDQSVDRQCLYSMNYSKVSVCETSDNEENLSSNAKIMSYLRRHVPKMFQSALSQLSLQQVQLVLDELCWRERYGQCAAMSYNNMLEHITYLTTRELENPGVLHLLEFVAQQPHHSWRYKSQQLPKGPTSLQPSIIVNPPSTSIAPQITLDANPLSQTPLDHNNKVNLGVKRAIDCLPEDGFPDVGRKYVKKKKIEKRPSYIDMVGNLVSMKGSMPPRPSTSSNTYKGDPVELEPYFYGQIQGDSSLGREPNTHVFICHICNMNYTNNINFYDHMKGHLSRGNNGPFKNSCDYCLTCFPTETDKMNHHTSKHLHADQRVYWCKICSESFVSEITLVSHMTKKHFESELPYRCEVCNFTTSFFFTVIDHFNKTHKDTPYVQCHFCLSVKSINASSANTFSQRLFTHLQKHGANAWKCKNCELNFYSKFLLDEHKKKEHIPRKGFPGLQRYKIPSTNAHVIIFRPVIRSGDSSQSGPSVQYQKRSPTTAAISATLASFPKLVVLLPEDVEKSFYCIECDANLNLPGHYPAYVKCTRCQYSTCCRNMLSKHCSVFHPNQRRRATYSLGKPIMLTKPLYCICGFSTRSGNHLARHLALCEGGRKSAYPSVLDAMVYHGDPVTGGAMSLATMSLANIIPGAVTITPDTSEGLDMSHFMSMSMEVDDA